MDGACLILRCGQCGPCNGLNAWSTASRRTLRTGRNCICICAASIPPPRTVKRDAYPSIRAHCRSDRNRIGYACTFARCFLAFTRRTIERRSMEARVSHELNFPFEGAFRWRIYCRAKPNGIRSVPIGSIWTGLKRNAFAAFIETGTFGTK